MSEETVMIILDREDAERMKRAMEFVMNEEATESDTSLLDYAHRVHVALGTAGV